MDTLRRFRGRSEDENSSFAKQRDRKQRRHRERQERKRARIEAHERWVEQRRLMREKRHEGRSKGQRRRDDAQHVTPSPTNAAAALLRGGEQRRAPAVASGSFAGPSLKISASDGCVLRQGRKKKEPLALEGKTGSDATFLMESATAEASPVDLETAPAKYIPPKLRKTVVDERNTTLDEYTRRIINKLTVRNVADMSKELSELFSGGAVEGATRASVLRSLTGHINRMCMLDSGPLTAVVSLPFAGLIRGLQLMHGNVVGAELIEGLCLTLHEHLQNNNETSALNGAMVLAYLYILHSVDSLLISTFLRTLLKIESHGAVCAAACGLTLLRSCGEKLLKEAPGEMEQVMAEAKARAREQQESNRYKALLGYITEIVTGRTRKARRTVNEEEVPVESVLSEIATLLPGGGAAKNKRALFRIINTANVLTGLTWERILCAQKPARWFIPGSWDCEDSSEVLNKSQEIADNDERSFSATSTTDSDDEADIKTNHIRQIRQQEKAIAAQRLNTENKREIFRCITSATDDLEAFSLLMHRDPSFSRLHDTLVVLLQCAYQEKVYNPYYSQVLERFCSAKASTKNTLQFAIWDMFKMIRVEAVDIVGYFNLSCLLAHFMEGGIFTLGVLRGLDLESTNRTICMFTRILLLRLIFQLSPARLVEVFFGGDGFSVHDVKIDTGILRSNLSLFMERYFVDEYEAGKWIPHFYDVVAAGTVFDMRSKSGDDGDGGLKITDDDSRFKLFFKRVKAVFKALKSGIV